MVTRYLAIRYLGLALLSGILLLAAAPAARACSLDGIASLSANGNTASLTGGAATASTLAYWAPFTLLAAAPGDTLRLSEDLGKIRKSLPPEAFKAPFRWTFGDGTVAEGQTAEHRYSRLGTYKITVSYYWPAQHRWIQFDSAEQQIVAAGDLWKVNFGYYLGKVLLLATKAIVWLAAIVLVGAALWLRLRPARTRIAAAGRSRRHPA